MTCLTITKNAMAIGVLAIQGDFAAHARVLRRLGADVIEVRRANDLDASAGLIVPGGESTTMLKFIEEESLAESITDFARQGKPIFGTCAGAIVLARGVYNPAQASLGLIDIGVERNGYGRQVDSFIAEVETAIEGGPLEAVFIRAPRIRGAGPNVEVVASLNDEPVLVREGNILAATFHPELTEDTRVHSLFVEMVRAASESHINLASF
ncbi:MAG TPA: pyridoxal 5'-phosphate synthase glutaminase subunit PdxT [Blastocatellia bacterium]|nr:pyridoxal 5'-phosphate synthase glutaminase subunit PdxT [Blastocatellia bacterium]